MSGHFVDSSLCRSLSDMLLLDWNKTGPLTPPVPPYMCAPTRPKSLERGDSGLEAMLVMSPEEASLASCAATALRNLCHQECNYKGLLECGAADALAALMQNETDSFRRINAAFGVAILIGQEENHPLLQLDEQFAKDLLEVLHCAAQEKLCHGNFWTCWKVCQAFARLTINDTNKQLITAAGGIGECHTITCHTPYQSRCTDSQEHPML